MNAFAAPHFTSNEAARKLIESVRWPNGPVCSHCGTINHAYPVRGRDGLYRCAEKDCRKDFTVTTGTVMERSKIPLHKWMMGFYLLSASKKGMSSHQLHRALGVTYQSAWFMCHRIREAMRDGGLAPLGGTGSIVEADETYYGPVEHPPTKRTDGRPYARKGQHGPAGKRPIVALVERHGKMRAFHVASADKQTVAKIVLGNISGESRLHTDESQLYTGAHAFFKAHETVIHSGKEYVRGDVHTNSVEGFFSIFKCGMTGVYQHCKEKHLHRYVAEFEFRYNHRIRLGIGDINRTYAAIRGAEGKRLMYRQPD